MDDRSLRVLEFYRLLDIMKEFSVSPLGRRRCENLRPTNQRSTIHQRLSEVIELKEILETYGEVPLRGLKDIEEILKKLDLEGSVLEVKEILDIYGQIQICKELKRFFLKLDPQKVNYLFQKISKFSYLKDIEKEILWAINLKGEILDRASIKLSEIRSQIRRVREKINLVLEYLLSKEDLKYIYQDNFITIRNGRYVLPVKSDQKNRLEGIIHDQSQSGMTIYLEPLGIINLNNEMNILSAEEKAEEYRILKQISDLLRYEKEKLWSDFEILGELDLLYAMAKLSVKLNGVKPIIDEDGRAEIFDARNPILMLNSEKEVVPIDIKIGDGKRVLIISGANAGGKTVALKTFGLLSLMVQSGIPIPVKEKSRIPIFNKIFAVIGDEQDIQQSLSTFSSHILHVNEVLGKSDEGCLVLLDELGVGTNTTEGCALAMAFLDRFREKGALVVVTTHFDYLKLYGYTHQDVENVSVEFDDETFEPRYRLIYGCSGVSNAFLVAEKLGISKNVLESARYYVNGSDQKLSNSLATLEKLKATIEAERREVLRAKEEIILERKRLKEIIEGIKRKRQEIFLKAEEKAKGIVKQLEEEVKRWIQSKKEELAFKKENINLSYSYKKGIKEIKERFFPCGRKIESHKIENDLKVGESVKIEGIKEDGILTKIDPCSERVEIITDRLTIKAPISHVTKTEGKQDKRKENSSKVLLLNSKNIDVMDSKLNVRGLRVEDALPEIDRFIDRAILYGIEKVYIIHGVGSGRLRNAISKFLNEHPCVKQFGPASRMDGGLGVTVIELR